MNLLRVRAAAKVNLTLDVLDSRPDGYHEVDTILQQIELCDILTLQLTPEPGIRLRCSSPTVPKGPENLAWRGAAATMEAAGVSPGAVSPGLSIQVDKRVPAQAGLGGGSSDAAAAALGTNRLLRLGVPPDVLARVASTLGSDVPFFLSGGAARATGRGERIRSLPSSPDLWLVVACPVDGVSTPWAYAALDAIPRRTSKRATPSMAAALMGASDAAAIARLTANDFEEALLALRPDIAAIQQQMLRAGAFAARVCGSGAAVFGIADCERQAESIRATVAPIAPFVCVTRTIASSRPGTCFPEDAAGTCNGGPFRS